ncbi:hypothetical protein B0H34DRAFT_767235 [Crassisporium funariophilum]|nr:hypothetical protein B0H34DRAFT_767235 [Crassisporium funariophilum]
MGPIESFFAQYPDFHYDASASTTSEFYRMCDSFGWDRGDEDRDNAHQEFRVALTQQFNTNFGTDVEDLAAWQRLCGRLGISPIPETLKRCRAIVTNTHVNLVDLVDSSSGSGTVMIFPSEMALSMYTISNGRFFPKEEAYAGELLKYLLRNILNPSSSPRSGRGRFRGSRGGRGRSRGRGQLPMI